MYVSLVSCASLDTHTQLVLLTGRDTDFIIIILFFWGILVDVYKIVEREREGPEGPKGASQCKTDVASSP